MPVSSPPLLELEKSRVQAAMQVVASWEKSRPDAAEFARDIDDVIVEAAIDWPQLIEKTYHREWRRAAKGPIEQCVPNGEIMFELWDSAAKFLQSVGELGRSLVAQGHAVPHLSDLDAAIDKLQRNRPRAHDNWPWFRPEDAVEAEAQIARGEYVTTEDLLREVQDRLAAKNAG